jgi:hypothetical protein
MCGFQEATEPVIEIHEDDPEQFEVMLKYLYTNKYESPDGTTELARRFLILIGVHTLADKYDVERLGMIDVRVVSAITTTAALFMKSWRRRS